MRDDPFPAFILIIMCIIGSCLLGLYIGIDGMEKRAIKNKAAFYDVDPDTGKVKFVWKNELLERPNGSLN